MSWNPTFHQRVYFFAATVLLVANPSIANARQEIDAKEIDALIQQLASVEFVDREVAATRITELGQSAKLALEAASRSPNKAIAVRAQQLLNALVSELDTELVGNDETVWKQIKRSAGRTRASLFQKVVRQGNAKLAYRLLKDFPELEQSGAFFNEDSLMLNNMLLELATQGAWEQVEWVINHPLTLEKSPATCYHYHAVTGTLDAFTDLQLDRIRTAKAKDDPSVSDRQIRSLLSILRINKQSNRFEEVIGWLSPNLQDEARIQCLLETGDWKAVLAITIDPARKRPGDGKLSANKTQLAFLQRLAGDEPAYQATVKSLKLSLEKANQTKDEIQSAIIRNQLLAIGLTNLDWPLVKANLDRKKEFDNYSLITELFRYEEAFEWIKLGDAPALRIAWFEDRIKQLKENGKKLAKLDRRDKEYRPLQAEINLQRNLIVSVADHLGTLGFDEESDLYLQMLFAAEEKNFTTRNRVIVTLLAHERYATVRKLVEVMLPQTNVAAASQLLFSSGFRNVSGVTAAAISAYPNPIDQLKAIAELTHSPLRIEGEFDFETELARYRSNGRFNSSGTVEWHAGQLLLRQGMFEESDKLFKESAKSGNYLGINEVISQSYRQGDLAVAATMLDDVWRTRRSFGEALLAAECFRQLAVNESDPERKQELKRQALEAGFAATASWHARSYSIPTSLQAMDQYDAMPLASFLLQSSVYSLNGSAITNDRYRPQLIGLLESNELDFKSSAKDSRQAGIEAAISILNRLKISSVESRTLSSWSQSALQTQLAIAKGEIESGQPTAASDRLLRCIKFHPADSTLGETTIAQLDALNASEQADRLFQALTQDYIEILGKYPRSALHRNNYAWICACARRRLDTVQRHIELARQLRPNNSSYADTMAEIKFRNGDQISALELNKWCIMLAPDKPFYRRQRSKFLSGTRDDQTE